MDHPSTLVFPDRREHGRYEVQDGRGLVVARILPSWTATSFRASEPDGRELCAATAGWLGLSGTWRATGRDGGPLLRVSARGLSRRATVTLARGGTSVIRGSVWRRDFAVTGDDGEVVLAAVPRSRALSLRPYDYAVSQPRPVFTIPEVVAVVQIWRMLRKAEADAAGGTAAMTATFG